MKSSPSEFPNSQDVVVSTVLQPGEPDPSELKGLQWMAQCLCAGHKYTNKHLREAEQLHGQRLAALSTQRRPKRRAKQWPPIVFGVANGERSAEDDPVGIQLRRDTLRELPSKQQYQH